MPSVPFPLWGHSHGQQLCQMTGFFLQRSVKATFHSPGVPHLCFSEEKPFDLPFRWPPSSSGLASVWTWDRGSSGHAAGERPDGEGGKPLSSSSMGCGLHRVPGARTHRLKSFSSEDFLYIFRLPMTTFCWAAQNNRRGWDGMNQSTK